MASKATTRERYADFNVEVSDHNLGLNLPQRMGKRLWLPMFLMGIMAFPIAAILGIIRATAVVDGDVYLVLLESGEVLALSTIDPHLGCKVPFLPDFKFMDHTGWFRNPCHGETYDLTGVCYVGPCPRGLDRYEVRVRNGDVEVNFKHLTEGPEHATRDPVNLN